jgi:hypothetical protein
MMRIGTMILERLAAECPKGRRIHELEPAETVVPIIVAVNLTCGRSANSYMELVTHQRYFRQSNVSVRPSSPWKLTTRDGTEDGPDGGR